MRGIAIEAYKLQIELAGEIKQWTKKGRKSLPKLHRVISDIIYFSVSLPRCFDLVLLFIKSLEWWLCIVKKKCHKYQRKTKNTNINTKKKKNFPNNTNDQTPQTLQMTPKKNQYIQENYTIYSQPLNHRTSSKTL